MYSSNRQRGEKRGFMKIRYIPASVTLLAGAVVCLICLMKKYDVTYSLEVLLVTLIIFASIGFKAQKIIMNVMKEQKTEEEERIRLAEWQEAERLRNLEAEKESEAETDEIDENGTQDDTESE